MTTLAGTGVAGHMDGAGDSAQLNAPTGLIFDQAGKLYITDTYNQVIRQMTMTNPVAAPQTPAATAAPGVPNTGVEPKSNHQPLLGVMGIIFTILIAFFVTYGVSKRLRKQR